jgi:hypothetical protein
LSIEEKRTVEELLSIKRLEPFGQLMLYYVAPGTLAMAGLVIYLPYRKK